MKANRKSIMNDEEAVSPVIAVILMVAITVVLAATVFVLVNELGQDVGQTGPTLGMTSASSTASEQWDIRLTAATQSADIADYTFVVSNSTDTESASGSGWDGTSKLFIGGGYCVEHTDAGDEGLLAVGDRLHITYHGFEDTDCSATAETMSGSHELEVIHRPSGSSAGSISRTF